MLAHNTSRAYAALVYLDSYGRVCMSPKLDEDIPAAGGNISLTCRTHRHSSTMLEACWQIDLKRIWHLMYVSG